MASLAERRVHTYDALIPLTPARLGQRGRADLLTGVVDDLDDIVGAQIRVTVPAVSTLVAWGITSAVTTAFDARVGLVVIALGLAVLAISLVAVRVETRGQVELGDARADVTRIADTLTAQAGEIAAIGAGPDLIAELDVRQTNWRALVLRQARGRALAAGAILVAVGGAVAIVALLLEGSTRHTPAVNAMLVLAPVAVADALTPLAEAARALARSRERPVALRPLDLDLPPGTHLAVSGPNGCGKSTLLAVLARHLDPQAGTYRVGNEGFGGRDVLSEPLSVARGRIAVVDDTPHIFASTLRANLRFARDDVDDTDLIAALVSGRPIILLDEPVAHLDSATARAVIADLVASSPDRTLVMVSHREDGRDGFARTLRLTG